MTGFDICSFFDIATWMMNRIRLSHVKDADLFPCSNPSTGFWLLDVGTGFVTSFPPNVDSKFRLLVFDKFEFVMTGSESRSRALDGLQVYLHGIESDISTLLSCTENKRGVYTEVSSSEAYTRASQFVNESQALYLKLSSMFNLVRETPTIEKIIQEGYIYLQKQQERLQVLLDSYGIEDPSIDGFGRDDRGRLSIRRKLHSDEMSTRSSANKSEKSRSSLDEWEAPTLEQIGLSETSLEALKTLNIASPSPKPRFATPKNSRKQLPMSPESSNYPTPSSITFGKVRIQEMDFEKQVASFVKQSISVSELSEKLRLLLQASAIRCSRRFTQSELEQIFQTSSNKLKLYCLALVQLKYLRIEGDDLVLVEENCSPLSCHE